MTRIDADTNRVVARVAMPGPVSALGIGADAVWVAGGGRFGPSVRPRPHRPRDEPAHRGARARRVRRRDRVATTPGATWTAANSPGRATAWRGSTRGRTACSASSRCLATRFPTLGRVAADDRSVWFVSALDVGRIDPRTNRLTASVNASSFKRRAPARADYSDLGAAVVVDGDLWVADPATPAIVRVGRAANH